MNQPTRRTLMTLTAAALCAALGEPYVPPALTPTDTDQPALDTVRLDGNEAVGRLMSVSGRR